MKARIFLIWFLLFFSLFVSIPFASAESSFSAYEVEGDHVYVDNVNIHLDVWPHTSSGGWVYLNLTAKQFSGTIDLVFGFDSLHRPSKFQLYQPYTVQHNHNESIPAEYLGHEFPSEPVENRSCFYFADGYSSPSQSWSKLASRSRLFVGGVLHFYKWNNVTRMWDLQREQTFDYFDNRVGRGLFIWHTSELIEWLKWAKSDFKIQKFNEGGMKTWYVIPLNVNASKPLRCRFFLDVLPTTDPEKGLGKYTVAVKRHSESFFDAIRFRHFYALDPWWDATWQYKMKLTTNSSRIDADLTDFPFMVHLTSARINWTQVQDDLDDLRFVNPTETAVLDAELEDYTVNDEAWIHFRGPSVDGDADQDFYLYWGNPSASSAWDAEGVWDANFVAVYHMTDNPDTSHIADSTSNNNDGTKKAANEPLLTSLGLINSAQLFDNVDDYISVLSAASLQISGSFTISVCFYALDLIGLNTLIRRPFNNAANYDLYHSGTSLYWEVTGLNPGSATYAVPFVINTQYIVVMAYDNENNELLFYINGALFREISVTGIPAANVGNLWIGNDGWADVSNDILDEFRISSNICRSVAWIKAEYWSGLDGLLTYGVASELTPPTIGEFEAPAIVYPSKSTWLNVTASYEVGQEHIKNVSLALEGAIELGWDAPSSKVEWNVDVLDEYGAATYAEYLLGQTFTTTSGFTVTALRLKMLREGNCGTINASIRSTLAGVPTNTLLTSGTLPQSAIPVSEGWVIIPVSTVSLSPSTKYVIVLSVPDGSGGDDVEWFYTNRLESGDYTGGMYWEGEVGNPWFEDEGLDFLFEVWGYNSTQFYEIADPNNYFLLDASGSVFSSPNATSYKVCFRGIFASSYPEGYKDGDATVWGDDEVSGTASEPDWFLFSAPPMNAGLAGGAILLLVGLPLLLIIVVRRRH